MEQNNWSEFGRRLERRLIRVLDLLSILLFDAVILLAGYGVIWVVDRFTSTGDDYFDAAKAISHGAFVLFYVAWVGWDLLEFAKGRE